MSVAHWITIIASLVTIVFGLLTIVNLVKAERMIKRRQQSTDDLIEAQLRAAAEMRNRGEA